MTKIGEARWDENRQLSYGQPGDQTGDEVSSVDFYINDQKPWQLVFRAKRQEIREKLAQNMFDAGVNENIGYAQYGDGSTVYRDRYGLYYALKDGKTMSGVTIPCNCDCSSLVAQCCILSGINVSIYMSTSNEVSVLMNTGEFDQLTFERGMILMAGDIMWRSGHTGIITEGTDPGWSKDPKWVGQATTHCNVYNSNYVASGLLVEWPHLGPGNLVDVCDQDDEFYYVRIAGQYFGFVEQKYLTTPPPVFEPFKGKVTTALNIRKGPGVTYGYYNVDINDGRGTHHVLYQGEIVKVIDKKNNWYQLEMKGTDTTYYPWASATYIKKVEDEDIKVGDKVTLKSNILYTTKDKLQGTVEKVDKNDWFLIKVDDGCVGYIDKEDIEVNK